MHPIGFRIRLAETSESVAIAALLLEAFETFRPLYTEGGFAATTPSAETIRNRWTEGPSWLAYCGDRPVGTISAVFRNPRVYLRSMAVHPAAQGQSIGSSLLQTVESYALERKAKCLYLSTTPFLASAIHLYEEFGFVRTEEEPHDLFGTPLFTMEKKLNA